MLGATGILMLLAAPVLLFAALCDVGFRAIPDWISAVIAADGCLLRLLDHSLPAGLACGFCVFMLAAICWRRDWLGGGDVKLLGATAVLVPPDLVPSYVATVAFAGGGLALIYLVLERVVPAPRLCRSTSLLCRIINVEYRRIHRRTSLPYATAISAAALLILVEGWSHVS